LESSQTRYYGYYSIFFAAVSWSIPDQRIVIIKHIFV
jgi:hypothetical protein